MVLVQEVLPCGESCQVADTPYPIASEFLSGGQEEVGRLFHGKDRGILGARKTHDV